jgi:branched-chain amino acid transport system substrate-binding protein
MSKQRFSRRSALKLGVGATAAAGLPLSTPSWGQATFKVASINSLSGGFARYGQELQRGIDIAVEQINAKGVTVGGTTYTFAVQTYDDKTDSTVCSRLVEKAVTSDNANFVIAGVGSVIAKSVIPVAQRLRIAVLAMWAQVDGVFAGQRGDPYLFGVMPPFSQYYTQILGMGSKFVAPEVKRVAMITPSDELGVFTARDYLPSDVRAAGLELAGTEFFAPKSQDFGAALERITRLKPDIFIINCYTPEIIAIFKEMQTVRFFPAMIVVEAPTKLQESLGDDINGVFAPTFWDPTLDKTKDEYIGTSRDFAALYKKKHGEDPPDFVAACGANNLVVLAQVLKSGTSVTDQAALLKQFRTFSSQTFFSPVKFEKDGLNRGGVVYPSQFRNGKPVLVYPPEVALGQPVHPYPGFKKT